MFILILVGIENAEGRPRVTVPRLSYRTRIDEERLALAQRKPGIVVDRIQAVCRENARAMGVAEKAQIVIEILHIGQMRYDILPRKEIAVAVAWGSVGRKKMVEANVVGEVFDPREVVFRQLFPSPQCRMEGNRIEPPGFLDTASHGVVIATNRGDTRFADTIDTFVWAGIVANHIAQTNNLVDPMLCNSLQHRFYRFEVGMQI